jgi:translation initiation factor 2-alpha kinase 4
MGIQIAVEKIAVAVASFQRSSAKALVKEQHSFGFWSPRRCDVYIVSYHPGYLQDRLEVASYLRQYNISADIMYESGLPETDHERHIDLCSREGILYGDFTGLWYISLIDLFPRFTVCPQPRTSRRDQHVFKIKSVLKGTEYERTHSSIIIASYLSFQVY